MKHIYFINLLHQKGSQVEYTKEYEEIPFFNSSIDNFHFKNNSPLCTQKLDEELKKSSCVYIFCDGSKLTLDGKKTIASTAWALVSSSGQVLFECSEYTKKTYNYETQSILRALSFIKNYKHLQVNVLTDSMTDVWLLKNFETKKFKRKLDIYNQISQNRQNSKTQSTSDPSCLTRPKRWRGSENVDILLQKSHQLAKILTFSSFFMKTSFFYLPRKYNWLANDLAKEKTLTYFTQKALACPRLKNLSLQPCQIDSIDSCLQALSAPQNIIIDYKAYNNLKVSINNCSQVLDLQQTLNKQLPGVTLCTQKLVLDYVNILNELKKTGLDFRNMCVILPDQQLSALLDGKIDTSEILKNPQSTQFFVDFITTLSSFKQVQLLQFQKVKKKTIK